MSVQLEGRLANPARVARRDLCPIERTFKVVGTRSAMLLIREAAYGTTRFDDFVRRAGLTETVASSRLRELVDAGLLSKQPYREPGQRTRHEYLLTAAGADLMPTLVALADWGAEHLPHQASPSYAHAGCGEAVTAHIECAAGHAITMGELVATA
ncbi:MAG: helix-turn-helix domain-containing protein [Nocardioidaceae bacterium]